LRKDGFIILAQALIRTGGLFRPCKVLQIPARCARQPRPNFSDTNHPKNLNGVLGVNRSQGKDETDLDRPKTVYPKIVDCARMASSSLRKR
jgi:hypothetical protein